MKRSIPPFPPILSDEKISVSLSAMIRGVCELPVLICAGNSTGSPQRPVGCLSTRKILHRSALFWSIFSHRMKYIVFPSVVRDAHASCCLELMGAPRFTGFAHAPFHSLIQMSKPPTPGVFIVLTKSKPPSALSPYPRRKFNRVCTFLGSTCGACQSAFSLKLKNG